MKLYNGSCVYLTARTRPAVHHDDVAVDDSDTCVRVGAVMIDGVFLFVSTQRPAVHHDDVAVDDSDSDTCVRVGAVMIDGVFLFVSTQPRLVANLHCALLHLL